jgi:hypothetical protein
MELLPVFIEKFVSSQKGGRGLSPELLREDTEILVKSGFLDKCRLVIIIRFAPALVLELADRHG